MRHYRPNKAVLKAMARPGSIVSVSTNLTTPTPLTTASAALSLTLFDLETPLWSDLEPESDAVRWLRFHCGVPITADPRQSAFALITRPDNMPPLSGFDPGSDLRPENSTTLIIQIPEFQNGDRLNLRGSGVDRETHVTIAGLSRRFWRERQEVSSFPCGIDLFFCCGRRLLALPRTTQVE